MERPLRERPVRLRHVQVDDDGVRLAVHDWPAASAGDGSPATVLFVHATGYHSRLWDSVISLMPRSIRCVAIDLRGHGMSDKPHPSSKPWSGDSEGGYYPYPLFGRDVLRAARALGLAGCVAVGHSMGAAAILNAAVVEPALFSGMLLLDPIIVPPERYATPSTSPLAAVATKRRSAFNSSEEFFDRLADRYPFNLWQPSTLADYCIHGLLPASDVSVGAVSGSPGGTGVVTEGKLLPQANHHRNRCDHHSSSAARTGLGPSDTRLAGLSPLEGATDPPPYTLACPPAIEGAAFGGSSRPEAAIHDKLAAITAPVLVLIAGRLKGEEEQEQEPEQEAEGEPLQWAVSPTDPELATRFGGKARMVGTGLSHFIPFEDPALVAGHAQELLRAGKL